jgi:hypothetical protein
VFPSPRETNSSASQTYLVPGLSKKAILQYNRDWDALVVKLSDLVGGSKITGACKAEHIPKVRTRGVLCRVTPVPKKVSAFVRQTAKYWVHGFCCCVYFVAGADFVNIRIPTI